MSSSVSNHEMFFIPLGFHFDPTEVEILHYLSRKVKGESLPQGVILDIDLYGNAPWHILKKEDSWHNISKNNCQFLIYVFTKLKKIGDKKRVVRRAGCGTWDGQNKPEEIYNRHKQLIGSKKMLAFEANIKKDEWSIMPRGHWTMHEYSLGGVSLDGLEDGSDQDYVICKIKRDDSKFLRRAPKHVREVSKEENPSRKKKKTRYDHDEASASTPPQKTPLATSSDFQPLPEYYDETDRLFDLPNINSCGTIEGLQQIDLVFDNFDATATSSDIQTQPPPHDDDISTMNSCDTVQDQDLQQIESFFGNFDFETDFFDLEMEARIKAFSESLLS